MGFFGLTFDLREQLTFYGAYHNNPINQAIHFVFVPAILFTVAVWLAYTPSLPLNLAPLLSLLPACCAEYAKWVVLWGGRHRPVCPTCLCVVLLIGHKRCLSHLPAGIQPPLPLPPFTQTPSAPTPCAGTWSQTAPWCCWHTTACTTLRSSRLPG